MRKASCFVAAIATALASVVQTAACFAADRATTIYRCEVDGVKTFSDRACGVDAKVAILDVTATNTYEAASAIEARGTPKPKRAKSTAQKDASSERRSHEEACKRLSESLQQLRSKMRSGYTAKEGERLRTSQDKLRERQRALRCS
jgi:hypothetical protein